MRMVSSSAPERTLALLLAGTADRRRAASEQIADLAAGVDDRALTRFLEDQSLLGVLGTRLARLDAWHTSETFRHRVDEFVQRTRHQALVVDVVEGAMLARLEHHGIPVVAVKGHGLGARIYGEVGLRASSDIDLLVRRDALRPAVSVLAGLDYWPADDAEWRGMPDLEYTLRPRDRFLPPVDVHWRLTYYEASFSAQLLERALTEADGRRRLLPFDELACLLLFYARDSFYGLRYAVDVAACWDSLGVSLGPGCLDELLSSHPAIRPPLLAALATVDRLLGVPSEQLTSGRWTAGWRERTASRLADWSHERSPPQNTLVIEGLLAPRWSEGVFVRRHFVQPLWQALWPRPGSTKRNPRTLAAALRELGVTLRKLPRAIRAVWVSRRR